MGTEEGQRQGHRTLELVQLPGAAQELRQGPRGRQLDGRGSLSEGPAQRQAPVGEGGGKLCGAGLGAAQPQQLSSRGGLRVLRAEAPGTFRGAYDGSRIACGNELADVGELRAEFSGSGGFMRDLGKICGSVA